MDLILYGPNSVLAKHCREVWELEHVVYGAATPEELSELLRSLGPATVINFAAGTNDSQAAYESSVKAAQDLINVRQATGVEFPLYHISSHLAGQCYYGWQARGKREQEQILTEGVAGGLTIIRLSHVLAKAELPPPPNGGPPPRCKNLMTWLMWNIAYGQPIPVPAPPGPRNYTLADDLAELISNLLKRQNHNKFTLLWCPASAPMTLPDLILALDRGARIEYKLPTNERELRNARPALTPAPASSNWQEKLIALKQWYNRQLAETCRSGAY